MNDLFYYIAFLYIIYDLHGLIKTFTSNDANELADRMQVPHDYTDGGSIMGNLQTVSRYSYEKIFSITNMLFFWGWMIMGACWAVESTLFSALITLNILNIILPLVVFIVRAFLQSEDWWYAHFMKELKNSAKSNSIKGICVVDSILQYCVVGYLLYSHFGIS